MKTTITLTAGTTGSVSSSVDVSQLIGDFTISATTTATPGSTALVSLQTSTDGFVSDIQTVAVYHIQPGTGNAVPLAAIRAYQVPASRFGVASVHARLAVQSILGYEASVSVAVAIAS